ncbi:hypothetical protein PSQ90_08500 [Devosia rhodophyticola]|uniref:Uncharacterized protein n=1 Tax=Devosia rhodophyticola TaxID=3026423 RepID=A0ABY7Z1M8_9HYPH|nr:hypothetical protein [Devosia rhodophyticola]WDR07441.1 hypothetical protein PSQ90_08500 [Devosia rhodophyticola]
MPERYDTEDHNEADPVVGEITLEFAKFDPVDRKGNPIPVAYNDLHLPTLGDVMNRCRRKLLGTGI